MARSRTFPKPITSAGGAAMCGVVTGALAAKLLPSGRRGEGLGLLGIVSGIPAVIALPTGVWLAGHYLAAATVAGAKLRLPLIFAAATVAAGMLDSFLPIAKEIPSNLCSAALLVQAITATLSRWQAGRHGDRYGHARLLIPALVMAALGMAAMMVLGSPVAIFAGMMLFASVTQPV